MKANYGDFATYTWLRVGEESGTNVMDVEVGERRLSTSESQLQLQFAAWTNSLPAAVAGQVPIVSNKCLTRALLIMTVNREEDARSR